MNQNENIRNNCSEKSAICSLFIFLIFAIGFNLYSIYSLISNLIRITKTTAGMEFDCQFYPKITIIAAFMLLGFICILLLILSLAAFYYRDPTESYIGYVSLNGLYWLLGPILFSACLYFLLNMQTFGYSCTNSYKKEYSMLNYIMLASLGTLGIIVTIWSCTGKLIKKLSGILKKNKGYCSKLLCYFAPEINDDEEERLGLRVDTEA